MTQFITLAGQKQVGKDTSAQFIKRLLTEDNRDLGDQFDGVAGPPRESHQVYIVHFADALKKACNVIFGIPLENMETEEGKQKLTEVRWPESINGEASHHPELPFAGKVAAGTAGYKPNTNGKFMTTREVLQFVGTELFRNQLDPDVWLNSVFLQPWDENDIVIIADARFPNEATLGRENGLLINIQRETGIVNDGHKSENALADYDGYHYVVQNNSSFDDLRMHLGAILIQNQLIVRV